MNPGIATTYVVTFALGDGRFEQVIVHAGNREAAIAAARGTLEVATLKLASVYEYDARNFGAVYGLTYRPASRKEG